MSASQSLQYTYVPISQRPINTPFMRLATSLCVETMIKYASHLIQYRKQLHDRARLKAIKPLWLYDAGIQRGGDGPGRGSRQVTDCKEKKGTSGRSGKRRSEKVAFLQQNMQKVWCFVA